MTPAAPNPAGDMVDNIMQVMEAAFDPAYGEAWNRRQVSDLLIMPGTFALLLDEAGEPLTHSSMMPAGFTLSRQAADEEELLLIAVHPQKRRRGVGSALLTAFIRQAQSRGARRIFLEMREGNKAEALYLAHGFRKVGRRPKYYRSGLLPPMDAITFARDG